MTSGKSRPGRRRPKSKPGSSAGFWRSKAMSDENVRKKRGGAGPEDRDQGVPEAPSPTGAGPRGLVRSGHVRPGGLVRGHPHAHFHRPRRLDRQHLAEPVFLDPDDALRRGGPGVPQRLVLGEAGRADVAEIDFPFLILLVGAATAAAIFIKSGLDRTPVPPLVGYFLLGMLIRLADDRLGFFHEGAEEVFEFLAKVGVIMLLFRIGLGKRPQGAPLPAAPGQPDLGGGTWPSAAASGSAPPSIFWNSR